MSRTPGKPGDDSTSPAPVAAGSDGQQGSNEATRPPEGHPGRSVLESLEIDVQLNLMDGDEGSPAHDGALLSRDAEAAAEAGLGGRVDALMCARAMLAERAGDEGAAVVLWRSAFDSDPTLLVAFWGLRRALVRRTAWEELRAVIERRIGAVSAAERAETRAELWLEHGRISEDRLGRDDAAIQSYRAGLGEVPAHAGLLTSLLLSGFRRGDGRLIAEALSGFLRRALPPALRASISAYLARMERTSIVASGIAGGVAAPLPDATAAGRALDTLRGALRAVGPEDAGPLVAELALLARASADPAIRADILEELVSHLTPDEPRASTNAAAGNQGAMDRAVGTGAVAAAFLRERARLLRDELSRPAEAAKALRSALRHAPGHPIVIVELSDLIESMAGDDTGAAIEGLRGLLEEVAPGDRTTDNDAERELAVRYLVALASAGRWQEAVAWMERHPELPRQRPDLFALEMLLRAGASDREGLARTFEAAGVGLAGSDEGRSPVGAANAVAAAQAFVVAGTLREWSGGLPAPVGESPRPDANRSSSLALYERALQLAPDYAPARQAVERVLRSGGQWTELVAALRDRLRQLTGGSNGDAVEVRAILEELVALHLHRLDEPVEARQRQTELTAATDSDDVRACARRHHLELIAAARGEPSPAGTRIAVLRNLAERVDASGESAGAVGAALRVEAARLAAAHGDSETARQLFRAALPSDAAGTATAGLEGMLDHRGDLTPVESALQRADLVRAELARSSQATVTLPEQAQRLRALRFRLAWHTLEAGRADEALEVLRPLRASGDGLARAWSWEIARRLADPQAQLSILQSAPPATVSGLWEFPTDLGEALERAGDLPGAEAGFREAQRKEPSTGAALGLLRVGAALGSGAVVLEASRDLATLADEPTGILLSREVALLSVIDGGPIAAQSAVGADGTAPPRQTEEDNHPISVVVRWAGGARAAEPLGAAAGLLAFARALPNTATTSEASSDRDGLLARAAARARLGGVGLGAAVHDQVVALSAGAVPLGVGVALADLPVAGRPDRIAARVARAERNGGPLAYALDIERGVDAERRGEAAAALDAFGRALARDPEGIEALDGIKRLALATGDRQGAARAGMRLGVVLRVPARAAAELAMAAQLWEDLDRPGEAAIAYWQALARDPGSEWLYERLRQVLISRGDASALDRLYGHRLSVLTDPQARLALLWERALHRLDGMEDRKGAIEDFKRMLKIHPDHPPALRRLATLALQMEYFVQAVHFLERLLAHEDDESAVAALRLELAEAHEAARDSTRAIEVLRRAASVRPRDAAPWQRLTDLLLRIGDWAGALATLRSWDAVLADPRAKAALSVRIGRLLRDHGRDRAAAEAAFVTSAELDPLGDGIREVLDLHGPTGVGAAALTTSATARRQVLHSGIQALREELAADPLDVPRLRRLKELYEWAAREEEGATSGGKTALEWGGETVEGASVAAQLLAVAGEDADLVVRRRRELRGILPAGFWSRLRAPGGSGFAAELWAALAHRMIELFPPPTKLKLGTRDRERVVHGSEPRLAWVELGAVAVGVQGLELWMPRPGFKGAKGAPWGDASDEAVVPLEDGAPGLLIARGVLTGNAGARFRVGRALGLLRDRTMAMERISPEDLATLVAAAAVVAGASPAVPQGFASIVEEGARVLTKALSRKERKALEQQASRFSLESLDLAQFRRSVLQTADRLGLVFAGDIAVAVRVAGGFTGDDETPLTSAELLGNERALALTRFALSADYLALRRDAAGGVG